MTYPSNQCTNFLQLKNISERTRGTNTNIYYYVDAAIERDNQIAISLKGIDLKGIIKGGFVGLLTKGKFAIKTGATAFWTFYINTTTGAYDLAKDMFEHDQEVERQRNK